jgi:proton-dependent oligopeptide transporter, POT family
MIGIFPPGESSKSRGPRSDFGFAVARAVRTLAGTVMTSFPAPIETEPESSLDTCGIGGHPSGLTPLFFTEMWERFSFYGMRALLILFMTKTAVDGGLGFDTKKATGIYGTYTMSVYLLSILGGFIADNFIGSRRAVLAGGIIIATGHFAMAFNSLTTFYAGLVLIALGTGLLKPNISTMVGSLYQPADERRDAGFSIFYMGINLGAFLSPLVTGYLAQSPGWKTQLAAWGLDPLHSWHWGFAAAGVGMTLGLVVYLLQRQRLARVGQAPARDQPRPWGKLGLVAIASLALILAMKASDEHPALVYVLFALQIAAILFFAFRAGQDSKRIAAILVFFFAAEIFWSIFEQTGSSISLFADSLTQNEISGHAFPSSYWQSVNSIWVILLAPLFAWLWIKLGSNQPSSPMKFTLGLFFVALSFVLMIPAARLTAAGKVGPLWLVGLFFFQTVGEMLLSPVGLSTMTKLAPPRLVGLIMGIWFLAAALGNKLAGVLAGDFHFIDQKTLIDKIAVAIAPDLRATDLAAVSKTLADSYEFMAPGELATKMTAAVNQNLHVVAPVATTDKIAALLSAEFANGSATLSTFFWHQAIGVGVATLILFALVPWVKKLMGGVR